MKRSFINPSAYQVGRKRYAQPLIGRRFGVLPGVTAAFLANLLNVPDCGGVTSTFNSGVPLCDIIRDIPYGLIFLDAGVTFDAAACASPAAFKAAVATATRAARGSRAYPMWGLNDFTDNSKAPTKGTLGNLTNAEIQLIDGIPSFSFAHRKGDLFHSQLVKAEAAGLKVLIVDKKYAVYGTNVSGKLGGFTMAEFKAQLPKFQTPSSASSYPFEITLDSITEYRENLAFFQADSTLVSTTGNVNVVLSLFNQTTNVAKIILTAAGGKNIGSLYSTVLNVVGGWTITNKQTGASVTITSVTWDATNLAFVVTADNTAYGALTSGQKMTIDLASAAALAALTVDGFESTGGVDIVHA